VRALSPAGLLEVWDRGARLHPGDRALLLLRAALPGRERGALAALPLAERDRLLLRVHAATAGPELAAFVQCPACAERLELSLDADAIAPAEPVPAGAAWTAEGGGVRMRFRLPDSRDLAAAAGCASVDEARRVLAARCVTEAVDADGAPVAGLSDAALEALSARMDAVAPATDVSLSLRCPACATAWDAPLDVAAFVWTEVAARARRLLREVDAIARVYHWREAEILALPAARRRAYLALAES
jgi:hypothetical protein